MVSSRKKSLHKYDPGNGLNLHIFKMAAIETINVLGPYWLFMVDFAPYICISNR